MNKLLIICDMFPPAFAPRMGYLCKYLTRMGWEVTVVTEYIEDNTFEFLTGYADVYCVRYYKASGKISKAYRMDVGHVSRHLVLVIKTENNQRMYSLNKDQPVQRNIV